MKGVVPMAQDSDQTPCPGAVDGRSNGKSGDHHLRVKGVVPMAQDSGQTPCPGAVDGRSDGKSGDHHLRVKGVVPMAKHLGPVTHRHRRRRALDYFWEESTKEGAPPSLTDEGRVARAVADLEDPHRDGTKPRPTRAMHTSQGNRNAAARDDRLRAAQKRNAQRIRDANEADRKIIGEFLPLSPTAFFPCRMTGPNDHQEIPSEWVESVKEIVGTACPTPAKPGITFSIEGDARRKNWELLKNFGGDLGKVLASQRGTTAWHGSEFRPVEQLRPIVGKHPSFGSLTQTFAQGMHYHFTRELNEKERIEELEAQLARGNHKSAEEDPEHLAKLLAKDVKHGFAFALDAPRVREVINAMVQPCGLALQYGMKADGTRYLKKRLTHDLTYSLTREDSSVNSRIDMDRYPEMVYGWCLVRVIHFVICLRVKFPEVPIFAAKFDYSDAYRRVSHAGKAAAQTILIVASVAYVMLRLSFGGSPNPPTFCEFSEMLTDLANDLLSANIDPEDIRSPTVEDEHTKPISVYNETEPFAKAIPPAVEVPITTTAKVDCFVDDLVIAFLGVAANMLRACHAVPLAVHLLSRPHAGDEEPVPRRQLLEPSKLSAEGRPTEVLVVLGWVMDTRKLLFSLPPDKSRAWVEDLRAMRSRGHTTIEALEQMVGRLNHASYLIPLSRHFLNRLRWRIPNGKRRKHLKVRLSTAELEDLKLWDELLQVASSGISMNLLTIRTPTRLSWSDSCPFGLGGYTQKGRGWRLLVPKDAAFYGDDAANNPLEFLGLAITALLSLAEAEEEGEEFPCLLSISDSTSSIGWVFRSSTIGKGSKYYEPVTFIARHLASEVTRRSAQLTAQHLQGSYNDVADLMSFHGKVRGYTNPLTHDSPPDDVLSHRIRTSYPQLVTENFEISPLPPDVLSFACRAMQIVESSWIRNRRSPGGKENEAGDGGDTSSATSGWLTPCSIQFQQKGGDTSRSASWSYTGGGGSTSRADMLGDVRNRWWRRLSEMPLAMWQRRSGQTTGRVPSTTREAWPVQTDSERN